MKKAVILIIIMFGFFLNSNVYAKYTSVQTCEVLSNWYDDIKVDSANIECSSISDDGVTLKFEATDLVTGVKRIEFYINNSIYKTFGYNEWYSKNKTEEIFVNIDDMPFYEEAYIRVTDFYGNTLESNKIIPNKSRIYDLQDLLKFRDVVNSGIDGFSEQTIYLLNDIDLSLVSSNQLGSWNSIGKDTAKFLGTFNGNNHQILNLYINCNSEYSGFFGYVDGNIQNLSLYGNILNSGNFVGGIVAFLNSGKVENCKNYVEIQVNNAQAVGGIAGFSNYYTEITNCSNYASTLGNSFIGGIARL